MALVLRSRLEKLACGFPLTDNYFAWQAFGRGYSGNEETGPLHLTCHVAISKWYGHVRIA